MQILTLNKISKTGLQKLDQTAFEITDTAAAPQGIIVRSADMHQFDFAPETLAVARAGVGTNNIPIDACSERGVVVFYAPGANANAVKELVLTGILISSRKIVEGITWAKTLKGEQGIEKLVEKGKSQFAGPEIAGKTLGVIGLGAIGVKVANAAVNLGMNVIGFDPYLSVDAAWNMSSRVNKADSCKKLVSQCDYISIHVPLNSHTKNMFDKQLFEACKKGVRLLNFSRGEIVDFEALKYACEQKIVDSYITDFPSENLLDLNQAILIPHLGASTPESEEHCAQMAAGELNDYLLYGMIKNSVNFPDCEESYQGGTRLGILHANIPGMVSALTNVLASGHINIDNLVNKSKGQWAYTLIDVTTLGENKAQILQDLSKVEGVSRVRLVRED